jgi:hypothetical protein
MEVKICPKCGSADIHLCQNIVETTTNGFGLRWECKQCKFHPPKSRWQWISVEKATEIWNRYKRKQ